jgi:hypothetical protein
LQISTIKTKYLAPFHFAGIVNKSAYLSDCLSEDYGYDLTIFPALATPEYQTYSGDKIQGGIGDNLASMMQLT